MSQEQTSDAGNNWTHWTLLQAWPRIELFLDVLRETANVRQACKAAAIPRSTAYYWRKKWATFRKKWDEALEDACDILEEEARNRAILSQSDRLLMFLLKAHRPDKFKDRTTTEVTGAGGGPIVMVNWDEPSNSA